ncbi:MAG: hypothetical protein H6732_15000 [Alphaproteobacteria bacterium]|nr:hypothetical protein [Alphaproteobacteria bacterium]
MRALFLVNGLGLGNSTRCHAVAQRLAARGVEVAIMTSGNGVWYFQGRPEISAVHELGSFWYASRDGRISIVDTLAATGQFLRIARDNDRLIADVIADWKPDVALIDSVYTVCGVKRSHVPLAALNNADVVHVSYGRFDDRPRSIRAQFHAIEENDYRFHRWVPDRVVSPCLDPDLPTVSGPFVRTGPIVREGYEPSRRTGPPKRVLVMLSGSVFGTPVRFTEAPEGLQIDVVGRPAPDDVDATPGVVYHGKVKDNRELLREADLAIVNGGFSAVSELFAMQTPMVVVPVPNHAEQWVNARTVQHLGVGLIGSEAELEADMRKALDQLDALRAGYARLPPTPDGAAQAADALIALAQGR